MMVSEGGSILQNTVLQVLSFSTSLHVLSVYFYYINMAHVRRACVGRKRDGRGQLVVRHPLPVHIRFSEMDTGNDLTRRVPVESVDEHCVC